MLQWLWCVNNLVLVFSVQENCSTLTLDSFLAEIQNLCHLRCGWVKKWLKQWAARPANTLPTSSDSVTPPSCIWDGKQLGFILSWFTLVLKPTTENIVLFCLEQNNKADCDCNIVQFTCCTYLNLTSCPTNFYADMHCLLSSKAKAFRLKQTTLD